MDFMTVWEEGLLNQFFKANSLSETAGLAVTIAAVVLCMVISYLIGSVNFSIIVSKNYYHDDIRLHGSGNAGATNIMRTYGKKMAILTFAGDFLKAVVASLIGRLVFYGYHGAILAGLFCFLGHIFPCYFKFRGGKGVVTAAAMILMVGPWWIFVSLFVLFAVIVIATKYVSLGSVICLMVYPILLDRAGLKGFSVLAAIIVAAICVFAHRENIKRIMNGEESKISFKVKDRKPVSEEEKEDER